MVRIQKPEALAKLMQQRRHLILKGGSPATTRNLSCGISNTYDELGQLISKKVGNTAGTPLFQDKTN